VSQATTSVAAATDPRRRDAVREVAVFLATTFALTAMSTVVGFTEGVDVRHINDATALGQAVMYSQAFYPMVGVLAARATTPRERRSPWGFRRPTLLRLGLGWALGLGLPVVAAVICLVVGGIGVDPAGLGPVVPLGLTVLVLPYIPLALGEDIGWRGLLVTRLAQVSGPRTVVVVGGVVWGMFHWPLMIWLGGVPEHTATWFGVASFTLGTTALGALLANMQLRWGLWPGVVLHAVSNATLYHVLAPLTQEKALSGYLAGEVGLVGGLVTTAVALLWWRFAPLVRTRQGGTAPAAVRAPLRSRPDPVLVG
jgi:membrane protease YdiL (CAAX protease family)